ncbi:hypothetical protein ONS95_009277 [Cadophora gregata]|uniref:uncharacterized protein n=1 Tax=Cadophora gregata TaxID=51156 RepID=UPI0026DC3ACB|nr:uncharacterized protein ONS95_009277 [Cadophora gregata]KAK0124306.1 hypothetical protein ONS95_009277 [Cadophora gregata]
MVAGPDVITYIGVPLAVLGVLPIIYNTIATLATLSRVRRMLRHGRLAGVVRGDVINHVIEVELPRYTIAPLHREEQRHEYWRLSDHPSHIPGGTYTTFNWKRHNTGLKTQRIDYSDQLRQPQAEIGFEELLSFLLDLGAVPDPSGFRMLRGSGLWVPIGTPLLLSPDRHEAVLTIAPLDDSDGKLSLAVRWSSNWGMRDPASLPPYWVRLRGADPSRPTIAQQSKNRKDAGEVTNTNEKSMTSLEADCKYSDGTSIVKASDDWKNNIMNEASLPASSARIGIDHPETNLSAIEDIVPTIRCQVGVHGLISATPEDLDPLLFEALDTKHLAVDETTVNSVSVWFASVLTALSTSSQTILWNYKIPAEILAFAKRDTIPCGVLVLLNIVEESATPEWATKYNDDEEMREAQMRRQRDQSKALMREMQLPPAEKSRAFHERVRKEHDDWIDGLNATRRRDAQRAETRIIEAIQSPKWDNKLVAEHNLLWLKKEGHIGETHDLKRSVEFLLWRMVNEPIFAQELAQSLDSWQAFVDNGGLRKAEYVDLKEHQVMFGYASLLLAVIKASVTAAHGSLGMDLQECMRIWKTVRLG